VVIHICSVSEHTFVNCGFQQISQKIYNLTSRCHKIKTKKKFTKPQLRTLDMSIFYQKIMSICKIFEICRTRYVFSKPYENHKNHPNILLRHFFYESETTNCRAWWDLSPTRKLLKNSKVYKTRYKKTKNHKYSICKIIAVVAMVTCVQICADTWV